jgi:hypothetical protein
MAEPPKHSTAWCMINPGQAAADLDRISSAIKEALRLLQTGVVADRIEALVWLRNASQI